ncbi:hypothetical protein ACFQZ2_17870 [Streptomonospora algeriensis]|uniref:Zinc-binding dehydrogenase n=1 Tax=Streptomonospora algeriensis TaxID=995084 RepID=A0ABW3BJZ4_9ACTN
MGHTPRVPQPEWVAQAPQNAAWLVGDHMKRMPAFLDEVGAWPADGAIRADETFADGTENAPEAFLGMMRGENTGKMIVRL